MHMEIVQSDKTQLIGFKENRHLLTAVYVRLCVPVECRHCTNFARKAFVLGVGQCEVGNRKFIFVLEYCIQ